MKIYFAGSIRGGRDDVQIYTQIISLLQNYGDVLTEHIGDPNLLSSGEKLTDTQIHDRDMSWVAQSDVIVAEVTNVSLGVGYELGRGVEMGKKILCLYRNGSDKQLSAMIAGSSKISVVAYETVGELDSLFKDFLL